jgi:hypothetical protein
MHCAVNRSAFELHGVPSMKKSLLLTALAFYLGPLHSSSTQAQTSNNTIYACYQKENGQLRKVNGPDQCKPSEIPTSWSVAGVPGPKGDKGDKGETGVVDTSNFYTKAEIDSRFLQGAGVLSGGSAKLTAAIFPGNQATILDLPGVMNLRASCVLLGPDRAALFSINSANTTLGWDVFFDNGETEALYFNDFLSGNPLIMSGNGSRKFFAQLTRNNGSPTITVQGSVHIINSDGPNQCIFQWSVTSTDTQ